jgi:hypothetical protein
LNGRTLAEAADINLQMNGSEWEAIIMKASSKKSVATRESEDEVLHPRGK